MANNPAAHPAKRTAPWVWVAVVAVVVFAAAATALLTRGDTTSKATTGTTSPSGDHASPGENQQVNITGTPLAQLPETGADPAIGQPAPQLKGYAFDGSPVTIDWSKGPVMEVFVAHWCPHCNREVPELVAWKASGKVPANLQVIAISTAVNADRPNYPPSSWLVGKGWTWPAMADSANMDAARAMGVSGFPFVTIIGTDGKVLDRWSGEKGQAGIAAEVDKALGVKA